MGSDVMPPEPGQLNAAPLCNHRMGIEDIRGIASLPDRLLILMDIEALLGPDGIQPGLR